VGVKSDGTVVAVGGNNDGQLNVGSWTNIVQVAASGHTVGVKSDGTVVAAGSNYYGQCSLYNWDLLSTIGMPWIPLLLFDD
jgi:alpha-tubulin suppressor-like RCC1 family protein